MVSETSATQNGFCSRKMRDCEHDEVPVRKRHRIVLKEDANHFRDEDSNFSETVEILQPLCTCRVPDTINVLDSVGVWNKCQARDTLNNQDLLCCNTVADRLLARPHVRVTFRPFCEYHWQKMYDHFCCPICGVFCIEGRFFVCQETDDMHLFHEGCGQDEIYCPHCGGKTFAPMDIDADAVHKREKAKLTLSRSSSLVALLPPDIEKIRHKDSEKQLYNLSLIKLAESETKESLSKAIESAKKQLLDGEVRVHQFIDAVVKNNVAMVTLCLGKGISPNTKIVTKRTGDSKNVQQALHIACTKDYRALAYLLLQFGADVNAVDSDNCTPLMNAVINNNKQLVELLLYYKGRTDINDKSGNTALHFAAVQGQPEIIQLLLVHCTNFEHSSSTNGIKYLFLEEESDSGEDHSLINSRDQGGWTPLMWAAEHGKADALEKLLATGAQTNIEDNEKNLALHWACMSKVDKIVHPIVKASRLEEINAVNIFGDTPLIIACKKQFRKMFECLLEKGADYSIRNKQGTTAINICRDIGDQFAVSMIEAKISQAQEKLPTHNGQQQYSGSNKNCVVCQDLSSGKEIYPVRVINEYDDERMPSNFRYLNVRYEDSSCNFNRTGLFELSCKCGDECNAFSESLCKCKLRNGPCTFYYDVGGTLMTNYHVEGKTVVIDECTPYCVCPPTCTNRVAQHGMKFKLEIRRTQGRGWGLFTTCIIPARRFVCEYVGKVVLDQSMTKFSDDTYLFELVNLANQVTEIYSIDAKDCGNVARFINHSCEPNVSPINVTWDINDPRCPHICFFSNKAIQKGEELCFDYGEKFWLVKGEKFECKCGSTKCQYSGENLRKFLQSVNRPPVSKEASIGPLEFV